MTFKYTDNPTPGRIILMRPRLDAGSGAGSRGGRVIGRTKSGKPIYATGNRGKNSAGWTPDDHRDAKKHHDREVGRLLDKKQSPQMDKDVSKEMERLRQHSQHHLKQSKKSQRELDGKRKFEL